MKEWTFLHIILWLASGLPQPHTAAIPSHVECNEAIAQQIWSHYVADLPAADATDDFAWSCDYAKAPDPAAPDAAPTLPPGHPDISKKAKGDEA